MKSSRVMADKHYKSAKFKNKVMMLVSNTPCSPICRLCVNKNTQAKEGLRRGWEPPYNIYVRYILKEFIKGSLALIR